MPLIITPKGLGYYQFSDHTRRVWQYKPEDGNWIRLLKLTEISKGYGDQFTFGIGHFNDAPEEPVVSSTY